MRRVALGLGLIAATANVEASSSAATNTKSSLRVRRTSAGGTAAANGILASQHDDDAMDLLQHKATTMLGEGVDGPTSSAANASLFKKDAPLQGKKKREQKVISERGLHKNPIQMDQVEADDAMALEDEGYWDRFLQEDQSIEPTPPPTPRPTPPPTPRPTLPRTTPAPTPRPTAGVPTTPAPTLTCNLSPEERAAAITDILRQVSNPIDFIAPFSPQSQSLRWITEEDSLYLCPDDPFLVQRYTMAVFYFSTDGPNWVECSAPDDLSDPASIAEANANCALEVEIGQGGTDAWLTPVSECQWGGVACDPVSSDMERIEFEKNNLAGTIPRELQELSELRFLHMEEGRTGGTIPPELGNLSNLLELDMNFNALTGSIPANMYNLANLLEFDMNDNNLSGKISPDIQKMAKLTFLQFHRNQFTGSIPAEVGNLDRLIVATFDTNFLQDPMPEEVCLLRAGNLRTLTSDCLDPFDPFYVECATPCCTQCF